MTKFLLVLLTCLDAQCEMQSAYVADTFQAAENLDALDDCNAAIEARGNPELVCLTPAERQDLIYGAAPTAQRTEFTL